jgi:hypothetical protein
MFLKKLLSLSMAFCLCATGSAFAAATTASQNASLNTTNGIVTLKGTVEDPKDQQKIISEIQKVPGVKSVKSNLKFQKENYHE